MSNNHTQDLDPARSNQHQRAKKPRRAVRHIDRTGIAAGLATCAIGLGAAWLAGYDFNARGVDVAAGAVAVLGFSGIAAFVFSKSD